MPTKVGIQVFVMIVLNSYKKRYILTDGAECKHSKSTS